ncbi:uncharacterized protein N0V89_001584 [Didymosphaeria variabile]|uniref:Uncharacterized protein n=1 Tax=Didymosphaeria variabile TaxID=1932322 RepID=A0A9W8XYD6_9PLEO|nr:uncharacterized protein N0V89_001584 [Didymosphaeria variabile]KAJ4361015.1 hypothetical protein N0V89_001584 [Didymosphaeria variabile]
MAVRSTKKGEEATARIRQAYPDCNVEVWELDVLSYPSIQAPPHTGRSEPGRLTVVGSGTALFASFDNRKAEPLIPNFDDPFSGLAAEGERYGLSKLLVMILV